MLKIGLTGGIGSGKTTVCKLFAEKGIPIYYADDRAKYLMNFDPDLKSQIKQHFGKNVYHSNGRVNRKALASIIFSDKSKLSLINSLVHPAVALDSERWFDLQKSHYAIKEAALMIESKSHLSLDKLIVVTADIEQRIKRVIKRDQTSRESVQARIDNQMDETSKLGFADFIIQNNDLKLLQSQVDDIHATLMKM